MVGWDEGWLRWKGVEMRLIHPAGAPGEVSDADLAELYAMTDRSRPRLRVNFVASLDGAAEVDGRSGGLSGAPDMRVFKVLRNLADAVLVGAGTVRAESYRGLSLGAARREWRRAAGLAEVPTLVVVSSALDIDTDVFADIPVRPIVVTHAASPADRQEKLAEVADVVLAGASTVDFAVALPALAERGLRQVLCEGGPALFGSLQAAGLVDELCLTLAPIVAGPGASRISAGPPSPPTDFALVHALEDSGMLLLRYQR
ncbi:pyrimidine reductase family protein [Fodinicola feengrottensis]|uniref:Pyrimidine reductase family protein n=1 Tax=Fodinicola feengrottensis TaxID=435914 RepID=A0ABP4V434_9ACTN